jgi:transcriptional regulator with XRE-family HTH domain
MSIADPIRVRFGQAAASWRAYRKESLAAVAARVGVAPSTVQRWERAELAPDVFEARRLALALDVRVDELLCGVGADRVYGAEA